MLVKRQQVLPEDGPKRVSSLDGHTHVPTPLSPTLESNSDSKSNNKSNNKDGATNESEKIALIEPEEIKRAKSVKLRPADLREDLQVKLQAEKQRLEMNRSIWWSSFKARSGAKNSSDSSGYTFLRWMKGSARRVGAAMGMGNHHKLIARKKLLSIAKTGDLLLLNLGQGLEGRMVPLGIIRGIVSTNARHFLPKVAAIEPWNEVSIVVCLDDGVKHLLGIDASGIVVRKLDDVLSLCIYRNITCALRPLQCKLDAEKSVDRLLSLQQSLKSVAQLVAISRGIQWTRLKTTSPSASSPPPKMRAVGNKLSQDVPIDRDSLAEDSSVLIGVLRHVLHRVARVARQPSPDEFAEVMRIFFVLDEKKRGIIELAKLRKLLLGGEVFESSAAGLGPAGGEYDTDMNNIIINNNSNSSKNNTADGAIDESRQPPTASAGLSIHTDGGGVGGYSGSHGSSHPHRADARLMMATQRMLGTMGGNADGVITVSEFLDNYLKVSRGTTDNKPTASIDAMDDVPEDGGGSGSLLRAVSEDRAEAGTSHTHDGNIDIPAVAKGEFIGALLLFLGVLQEHRVEDGSESSDDVCDSPNRPALIEHSSAFGSAWDSALPRRTMGFFSPSSFSSQGPPVGHQGVDLQQLLHHFQSDAEFGSVWVHTHRSNTARSIEGIHLKCLSCAVHVLDKRSLSRYMHDSNQVAVAPAIDSGKEVFTGGQLVQARRHLNIRLADGFSLGTELFLSRNAT